MLARRYLPDPVSEGSRPSSLLLGPLVTLQGLHEVGPLEWGWTLVGSSAATQPHPGPGGNLAP